MQPYEAVYPLSGDTVKRGQVIGKILYPKNAKLMVTEMNHRLGWVDPDNFGVNHSYMDYFIGPLEIDREYDKNRKLCQKRWDTQLDLLTELDKHRVNKEKLDLYDLKHRVSSKKPKWAINEKFKFLETLYEAAPQVFPTLEKDEYQNIKDNFYVN